jgi:hypothetical protein
MISKVIRETKTFRDSRGFIGKSVPVTPTFLGYFILKQSGYFNRDLADSKPLSIKEDEKEVVCYVY